MTALGGLQGVIVTALGVGGGGENKVCRKGKACILFHDNNEDNDFIDKAKPMPLGEFHQLQSIEGHRCKRQQLLASHSAGCVQQLYQEG